MDDEIYLFLKNGMIPEFEALLKIARVDINSSDILKKAKELCVCQEKIWCVGKETSDENSNCNKPLVSSSLPQKCNCGKNCLPYDAVFTIKKCKRCGNNC
jgi:hypothetical protein